MLGSESIPRYLPRQVLDKCNKLGGKRGRPQRRLLTASASAEPRHHSCCSSLWLVGASFLRFEHTRHIPPGRGSRLALSLERTRPQEAEGSKHMAAPRSTGPDPLGRNKFTEASEIYGYVIVNSAGSMPTASHNGTHFLHRARHPVDSYPCRIRFFPQIFVNTPIM